MKSNVLFFKRVHLDLAWRAYHLKRLKRFDPSSPGRNGFRSAQTNDNQRAFPFSMKHGHFQTQADIPQATFSIPPISYLFSSPPAISSA